MTTAIISRWRSAFSVLGAAFLLIGLALARGVAADSSAREQQLARNHADQADNWVLMVDASQPRNKVTTKPTPGSLEELQRRRAARDATRAQNTPSRYSKKEGQSGSDKERMIGTEAFRSGSDEAPPRTGTPSGPTRKVDIPHSGMMPTIPKAPTETGGQPTEMRLDAKSLPDVSEQDLEKSKPRPKTAAERLAENRAAARMRDNHPTSPTVPPASPESPAPTLPTPVQPSGSDAAKPSPVAPKTPAGSPGKPGVQPPSRHPVSPSAQHRPARPANAATPPQPAKPTNAPPPPADKPHSAGVPGQTSYEVVNKDGAPEVQRPEGWYKLPAEERMYFFVWRNTPLGRTLEDFQEMAGLSVIGGFDQGDAQQMQVSFESVQLQKFDDALTTYNEMLAEKGYWVVRAQNYLAVRRLTDWYRYIPPARMYDSLEAYRSAKLPMWEVGSVIVAPKNMSPTPLAARLMDSIPDNMARATVLPNSNKIELKGFVAYIERQLELAQFYDVAPEDGRVLRDYPLRYASPSQAMEMLADLMPPSQSGATVVQPSARPQPSVTPRRGAPVPPPGGPQPSGPVEIGPSTADDVDVREDRRKNQLLVRATEAKHKLVAEFVRDYIDVEQKLREVTKVVKLQYGDCERVAESVRPMLGTPEIFQPPAPPPRQGPGGQQIEQPAPPPQVRTTGSTALLQPIQATNSILVRATEDEMVKILELIKIMDVQAPDDSKLQPIMLKYASASNIANVLTQGLSERQGGRHGRSSEGGQNAFKAIADGSTDKMLVISGDPNDIKLAKDLIAQMDIDPEADATEHLVFLKNATPSVLSEMLTSRFGGQSRGGGGGGYSRRHYYGGDSGGSSTLPKFLSDDTAKILIVMCREEMWPQIDHLIKQVDEKSEIAKLTKTYRLKHADASNISNILQQSVGGGGGRRGWYSSGGGSEADSATINYEPQGNAIVVTARDEIHKQVRELIDELDQPSPSDSAVFRAIALTKADADYVAKKIMEMFESDGGGYGYRSRYGGGGENPNKIPVRVITESISNQIMVSSSEEDFKKAEVLAKQIDNDYAAKEIIRRTFELKFASPSEVSEIIQATFEARGTSGSSSGYGYRRSRYGGYSSGMSSEGPDLGVKISEIGNSVIVQAPKEKMEEIAEFIAEIDVDKNAGNELKIYKVKGVEQRGTSELAENLRQIFGGSNVSRYRGGGESTAGGVKFFGDYGSDVLMVSAPSSRMPEIDKTINEMIKAKEGEDLTMAIKHFVVRDARPQEVADIVEPVLESKYHEMQQKSGGGRYYGSSGGPRVIAHQAENKIMVSAPGSLMLLAEELIGEFDKPSKPSTTRFVSLKTAKALEIAPIVEEQISKQASSPSRRSSRSSGYGGYGGYGYGHSGYSSRRSSYYGGSSGSSEEDTLQVTPVESSNSIILTGSEEKVVQAEELIKKLDSEARPEGMFKVIKVEMADLYEVADMIESMVGGGGSSYDSGSSSGGYGGSSRRASSSSSGASSSVMIKTDYQTSQLIIFAPPEKFAIIDEIVNQMEGLAKAAREGDTGTTGVTIDRGKNGTTKSYAVKGPVKEIAKVLDDALWERFGYGSPYVKASTFTNEIIITGEPKQFGVVEELLKKIEKDPPQPKLMISTRRISQPQKVIEQLTQAMPVSAQPIVRSGARRSAAEMIREREVNFDDPIVPFSSTTQPESAVPVTAPFVPPVAELREMNRAVAAIMSMAAVAESQPAATQPASAPPSTAPVAAPVAETVAEPIVEPVATPAAVSAVAPAASVPPRTPAAPAERDSQPRMTSEQETYAQLYQAGEKARRSGEAQIRYDTEQGFIIVVGEESQVKEIELMMDSIIDELKDIEDASKIDFKVLRVQYVAVEVAAEILNQMFNDQAPAGQKGKPGQPPKPDARKGKSADKDAEGQEGEEGGAGAARRREEEEKKNEEQAQAQASAAGQRIKVIPDPRTNTLIVRAAPDLFPAISELLLKIDRPGGAPSQKIEIFQLKKLNAGEVEQAIRVILKMDGGTMRSGMRRMPRRTGLGAAGGQADMIDQLQEQMLEMQMEAQEQAVAAAAAAAANGGQPGQPGKDTAAGKLRINPAKDIMITSDATTNTIICMAAEEGVNLIRTLINSLEEVEIPLEIKSFQVANGDAEKLAAELEKVFAPARGESGGMRGMGGFSPGRVGGDIKIAADNRTNTIVVRALKPDMEKIAPLIKTLDVVEQQIQIYPVGSGNAKDMAVTLSKIFAADGQGKDGARSTRITADEGTNSLLVYAPNEAKQLMIAAKIKELDSMVGESSKPKQIELKFADAVAVAATLKDVFVAKGSGNRTGKQQISFVGDANSGIVFVTAPDELFKQILKVTQDLDQPLKQEVQVFTLKHATASDVAKNFQALMSQMMATMKGKAGSGESVAITPDDRTNSLVVVGSPAAFMVVKAVLDRLDITPTDVTAQTVGFFRITGGMAETTAASVNALYANQKFPGGVLPPKAVAAGKDIIYVYGTQAQIQQVKAALIDPAEAQRTATAGTVQNYAIDLKHAKADEVAKKLQDWFKNRDEVMLKTGVTPLPSDSGISIQADTQAKKLFVYCSATNKKAIDDLLKSLDTPEMTDVMQMEVLPVQFTEAVYAYNALVGVMAKSSRPVNEQPVITVEPNSSALVVKATPDDMIKVKEVLAKIDKPGVGGRQTFTLEIKYADPDDIATTLTSIYAANRSGTAVRTQAAFNVLQGTRKILATTTAGEFENIKRMVEQFDLPETEKSRDMRVVPVSRIAPHEMGAMLTEYLRKPGRTGRNDPALLGDVRIVPSNAANAVVLTGPTDRLDELEQLVAKIDAAKPDQEKSGRQVAVIPLANANPYTMAAAIGVAFGNKRGSAAEADLVDVAAEPTTNTLVVTAMPEKLEKVKETIAKLDENSANKPDQQIIELKYARAEDLAPVLMATYAATKRSGAGTPVVITADANANLLVVSAGKADIEAIRGMVAQLDKRATDAMQEMRVMPLEYLDATETSNLLSEHLRKSGAAGRRGGGKDLVGDIKIQPSVAMNALIVSGAPAELDNIQTLVQGMDKELKGAGTAPRIIPVKNASASQLAQTLTQMFTETARQQRTGRAGSPDMVPLIMADETSGSLLVRAKQFDFKMIEDMVGKLDVPQMLTNAKVIKVSRGSDVATMARNIQDTINRGEQAKQSQRRDYRPGQVSIGYDERVPALLVAGSPELIPQVESLVGQLDSMKTFGVQQTVFIPTRSVAPAEIKKILDDVVKQQTGRK